MDGRKKNALARLHRDWVECLQNPLPTVVAQPLSEKNFFLWHGNIKGPPRSIFEHHNFHITIRFPDDYPKSPPRIQMLSGLQRAHIYDEWICLDMLEGWIADAHDQSRKDKFYGWSSAYTVQSILIQLQAYLFDETELYSIDRSKRNAEKFKCNQCHHTNQKPFPPYRITDQVRENPRSLIASVQNPGLSQDGESDIGWGGRREMPDVLTHCVLEFLILSDIVRCRNISKHFQKVIKQTHIIERRQLICFHRKTHFNGSKSTVLGIGITPTFWENHSGKKVNEIICQTDILSFGAFREDGCRLTVGKEEFSDFLPLYINTRHAQRSFPMIQSAMEKLMGLETSRKNKLCNPEMALDFISKLMNTTVVRLMNQSEENVDDATMYHSERALEAYLAFHHMLLGFAVKRPEVQRIADQKISRFFATPDSRMKRGVPNLGEFIVYFTVSNLTWEKVGHLVLEECEIRNAKWIVKAFPELSRVEDEGVSCVRLTKSFQASRTSKRLLMFQLGFLKLVRGTRGKFNLKESFNRYNRCLGRPSDEMVISMQNTCKRIMEISHQSDAYRELCVPPKSAVEICDGLRHNIGKSLARRYHYGTGGFPKDLRHLENDSCSCSRVMCLYASNEYSEQFITNLRRQLAERAARRKAIANKPKPAAIPKTNPWLKSKPEQKTDLRKRPAAQQTLNPFARIGQNQQHGFSPAPVTNGQPRSGSGHQITPQLAGRANRYAVPHQQQPAQQIPIQQTPQQILVERELPAQSQPVPSHPTPSFLVFRDVDPQAGQPQAGQPQAGQPQAGQPQAGQPQAGQPQAGQPQAGQPQAGQPQAPQPQAPQPQAPQPQAPQTQAPQPQAPQPQAPQPQAPQPQAPQAQAPQPQAPQPQAHQPQAPQPQAPQPQAPQPQATQPQAPQPQVPQPQVPQLHTESRQPTSTTETRRAGRQAASVGRTGQRIGTDGVIVAPPQQPLQQSTQTSARHNRQHASWQTARRGSRGSTSGDLDPTSVTLFQVVPPRSEEPQPQHVSQTRRVGRQAASVGRTGQGIGENGAVSLPVQQPTPQSVHQTARRRSRRSTSGNLDPTSIGLYQVVPPRREEPYSFVPRHSAVPQRSVAPQQATSVGRTPLPSTENVGRSRRRRGRRPAAPQHTQATTAQPPQRASVQPPQRASVQPPQRASVQPPQRASVQPQQRASVQPQQRASVQPPQRTSTESAWSHVQSDSRRAARVRTRRNSQRNSSQNIEAQSANAYSSLGEDLSTRPSGRSAENVHENVRSRNSGRVSQRQVRRTGAWQQLPQTNGNSSRPPSTRTSRDTTTSRRQQPRRVSQENVDENQRLLEHLASSGSRSGYSRNSR